MANPLLTLHQLGQRVWLDNLSRTLLKDGILQRLVTNDRLAGITSNPTIFFKAISESPHYRDELTALENEPNLSAERRYERLAIRDIQDACDLLHPLYVRTDGEDGYVSLEVSPALAYDAEATIAAGLRLKAEVNRANLLIKVPATKPGVRAIESLIGQGCSVNVTLMFSLDHVRDVSRAYMKGIEQWLAHSGADPRPVKSVASLFLSRVDTLVDKRLDALGGDALLMRGQAGVALAKLAYQEYKNVFGGPLFSPLAAKGARKQYLLWASTGTKNPAYSDVMYVEPLIGPETINTLPDATLSAFRDHGRAALTIEEDLDRARRVFADLGRYGILMGEIGDELQKDGVKLFQQSFEQLIALMS
ncbi:MAG TPA: transaldolase [Burkholderiales bacterium]|nr:transaldolase [Burkholderiales bacterium]